MNSGEETLEKNGLPHKNKNRLKNFFIIISAALLLSILAALIIYQAKNHWIYGDEVQVADGYAHLKLDFRVGGSNPPLALQLLAFPIAFLNPDFPVDQKSYDIGHEADGTFCQAFFFDNRVPHEKMIFASRMTALVFGLLTGILVFIWAGQLWNMEAAFCALLLYVLSPAIIAHSSTATTDIVPAFFFLLSIHSFWLFLTQPSKKTFIYFGVSTGLMFASKISFVLLFPIQTLILMTHEKKLFPQKRYWLIGGWCVAFAILVLNYGVVGFPAFFHTIRWILGNSLGRRYFPNFFFGEMYDDPPLSYIAGVFLLRNPIPLLIFFLAGLIYSFKKGKEYFLIVPVIVYFLFASFSKMQMGLRYVLPVYPFLCIMAGSFMQRFFAQKIYTKIICALMLLWMVWSNVKIFPHYIIYFNEFAGGAENGWKYLDHLDMGQDLKELVSFVKKYPDATLISALETDNRIERIGRFKHQRYFSIDMLQNPVYINPVNTKKEFLAVSISYFSDYSAIRKEEFEFLKTRHPIEKIGHTIWVYDVTTDDGAHAAMAENYKKISKENPRFAVCAQREYERLKAIQELLKSGNASGLKKNRNPKG